jgi:hypothetical protein
MHHLLIKRRTTIQHSIHHWSAKESWVVLEHPYPVLRPWTLGLFLLWSMINNLIRFVTLNKSDHATWHWTNKLTNIKMTNSNKNKDIPNRCSTNIFPTRFYVSIWLHPREKSPIYSTHVIQCLMYRVYNFSNFCDLTFSRIIKNYSYSVKYKKSLFNFLVNLSSLYPRLELVKQKKTGIW